MTYDLLRSGDEAHAILEPGLQNWGGILGLGEAVRWMQRTPSTEDATAARLFEGLQADGSPSPIVSFWVDGMDAHQLALYLSQRDIMCRSGYFCCHSYLEHQLHSPPLLRVSLGRYNTESHVDTFLTSLRTPSVRHQLRRGNEGQARRFAHFHAPTARAVHPPLD
jgi:selenocysteine lyase/cysteine desulfurase